MIQIYHGDGKGKTTAAVGLSVRACGHNIPVVFAQFLKDGSSGELAMLEKLGARVMIPDTFFGFVRSMSEEQLQQTKEEYAKFLKEIEQLVGNIRQATSDSQDDDGKSQNMISCVLVLDEILHACKNNLVDETAVIDFIHRVKDNTEIILTGRNPSDRLVDIADYCTAFVKEKHPFDQGITARTGIEM